MSGPAYVRRISGALLRRIGDALRTAPSAELGVIDIVRLSEALKNVVEVVNRTATPRLKRADR